MSYTVHTQYNSKDIILVQCPIFTCRLYSRYIKDMLIHFIKDND